MREPEVERKLVKGIESIGGKCYKWVSPGNNGVPDRIIILPGGRIIFAELKTDTGRLRPTQKVQRRILDRLGADVRVVKGETGVADLLAEASAWVAMQKGGDAL